MRAYLAEIYRMSEGGPVRAATLARRLDVTIPAVVRMLNRLESHGFIRRTRLGILLTEAGEREALRSIRQHRILEAFLTRVLNIGWEEVHALADRLDPAIDEALCERMYEVAGRPTHCPHGDPIPTPDGQMPALFDIPLSEAFVGARGRISRVKTEDPEQLRYLGSLGLVPGTSFELVARAPFNGPLRLRLAQHDVIIGLELAHHIRVLMEPESSEGTNP
ncbi:metal-dependent transcriptional regulator [Thermoflexus sp.]|uniref:metal-dependent transcriptional regulator n=1 Tax=Thermoflexus sp. TaxID=1969742 RepID=UPI0035E4050E